MTSTAQWMLAAGMLALYMLPAVPEVPLGGPPLTSLGLFVLVGALLVVFVAMPWRSRLPGAVRWTIWGLMIVAWGLKLTAASLASPQGLMGHYEWLVGVDVPTVNARVQTLWQPSGLFVGGAATSLAPGAASRPAQPPSPSPAPVVWQRCDRTLAFGHNGRDPIRDSFHLAWANSHPLQNLPKHPPVGQPDPLQAYKYLDGAALAVTWTGAIHFPKQGVYIFEPATDGFWSVEIANVGVVAFGGPGMAAQHSRRSLDRGVHPVVIRYLRPVRSADVTDAHGRVIERQRGWRFLLNWDPPSGGWQPVTWRRLYPTADISESRHTLNRVAEGLVWGAFGTLCAVLVLTWLTATDWYMLFRTPVWALGGSAHRGDGSDGSSRFSPHRLILVGLAILVFGIGFLELWTSATDRNAVVPADAALRRALSRAGDLYHHGGPLTALPPRPTAVADGSPPGGIEGFWLDTLETLVGPALRPKALDSAGQPRGGDPFPDTPLHDYWLAGLMALCEERLSTVVLIHTALIAALVGLVYSIARPLFGRPAALWSAALMAIDPHMSGAAGSLLADLPAAVALTAAVATLLAAARHGRRGQWSLAAALLTVGVLLKPDLILAPIVAGVWVLMHPLPGRPHFSDRWRWVVALVGALTLAASLVAVRNRQLCGQGRWLPTDWPARALVGTDALDPTAMYVSPVRLAEPFGNPPPPSLVSDSRLGPPCVGQCVMTLAEAPDRFANAAWVKLLHIWGLGRPADTQPADTGRAESLVTVRYIVWPLLYMVVVLKALGRILVWPGPHARGARLVAAMIAAVIVPVVLLDFQDRHRVPMIPLLHVLAGPLLWSRLTGQHPLAGTPDPTPHQPPASHDSASHGSASHGSAVAANAAA